ncbi:hypothetical protein Y5S_02332 [Alcanivorax nanhaiticus]|uniref:Uncharacterized protein n=1 Tax=Alcanivorax nanhaiticus TaxID=1177154 RepID=A0A095SJ54_9GAMM|nr:hypothetical protein [Alcanivorax nanhaiticus]KGD64577.1 hypothetical protein Y5S_02332 [Alcanivorax nanhaiticus]
MGILQKLNEDTADLNIWIFSICFFTLICFAFDIYQIFVSPNTFLAIVSLICLLVGMAACFKWASEGFSYYFLVYLIPSFFLAISMAPGGEAIGINSNDYVMSAYATAGSALLPPIGTLITVPLVFLLSTTSKWLQSKI